MAEELSSSENAGGGSRLLVVIVIFQLLAIGGLAFFLFTMRQEVDTLTQSLAANQSNNQAIAEDNEQLTIEEREEKSIGPIVELGGQIVVNLRGMDGRNRLLRTSLSIEVDTEETRQEVESKIVMIRYNLTRLLSSRRPEEVIGAEQMELVRNAMKRTADAVLASKKGHVVNVWPNDWILE